MANSKSNIYPIQLQGAELNLNKLDAEIKQYSGFNKNNSPFVGGCLSNIFTKDETIEGATSKNTYIAPNGDVYRVNTEGLWKNGEKLIDTSEADFFDVVDLGADVFPENTVYVYDEETYTYIKDNKIYYHSGEIDYDFLSSFGIEGNLDDAYSLSFNIIKRNISGVDYELVGLYIDANQFFPVGSVFCLSIYTKNEDGSLNAVYTKKITDFEGLDRNSNFSNHTSFDKRVLVFKTSGTTYNDFKLAVFTSGAPWSTNTSIDTFCNFILTFDGENISNPTVLGVSYADGSIITNRNSEQYKALQRSIFTDKKLYFMNRGSEVKLPSKFICDYTVDFVNNKIVLDAYYNTNLYGIDQTYYQKSLARKWGCKLAVAVKNCGVVILDDLATGYGVAEKNNTYQYYLHFKIGGIVNDCVLLNNDLVSGLSLPGGWILTSEWNTVNEDCIFFGENTDEWRNNNYVYIWKNINTGSWYKLIKSTPNLHLVNNQIVINSNTKFNSYDIVRNKTLLFAPAWNNRHPDDETLHNVNVLETVRYLATSINEYNLEDNSSLILNPVEVCQTIDSVHYIDARKNSSIAEVFINVYAGNGTNIRYSYSYIPGSNNKYSLEDLKGLPFPTNTDGNVQYSPSLFATEKGKYGNLVFISEGGTAYKLMTYDNKAVMSYFLSTAVEGLQDFFTIQGQLYGILNNQIYSFSIVNEVANRGDFIVSVEGLQFVGNTPYEALFFSKTNRCLYSFTGANVLSQKQLVDKISEVRDYLYNPATQTVFLITDIGVLFYGIFGQFLLEYTDVSKIFLLNNGIVMSDNAGHYRYIKYYLDEGDTDFEKQNIRLETCFYGMNNQTVTINDCLYFRLFSEEHEEGSLKVSATTISLRGRKTEETTFKIRASDWDKITHTIYLRYQPKEQRGLGVSFSIDSPFKIAALSVGSQADAILVDKVSKGAINAPSQTSNNAEW